MFTRPGILWLMAALAGCSIVPGAGNVDPREFREVLGGWWDEGHREELRQLCSNGRTLSRHVFSEDGRVVTWEFERPIKIYDESEVKSLKYRVLSAASVSLTMALEGENRTDDKGNPVVWELVMVDDGLFRWRATVLPVGQYNEIWGRRCR
jgi:hypothetical protein